MSARRKPAPGRWFEVFVTLLLAMLSACAPPPEAADLKHVYPVQSYLTAQDDVIWGSTRISVCWENPTERDAQERDWVRDAVRQSWEDASALHFVGWNKCDRSPDSIRILIADERPHTCGIGSQLKGRRNGMVLDFTFHKWSPTCAQTRERCIRVTSVHEFGHALGFAHEQARADLPDWCTEKQDDEDAPGNVLIGPWDEDSVMNYCNREWSGNGKLSYYDRVGVQKYYRSGKWNVETGTVLEELPDDVKFAMGDVNGDGFEDLIAIRSNHTPSGMMELLALSGSTQYQSWIGRFVLPIASGSGIYLVADVNADGKADLLMVDPAGKSTGCTNVHVLSGADNFQRWIIQTATLFPRADSSVRFAAGDVNGDGYADLVAISAANGSEVHVLSGRDWFRRWVIQTMTPLKIGSGEWDFSVRDMNGDGRGDLVAIHKNGSPSHRTDLHVVGGPDFNDFVIQTPLQIGETGADLSFFAMQTRGRHYGDVAAIKRRHTGTRSTEIHIIDGSAHLP